MKKVKTVIWAGGSKLFEGYIEELIFTEEIDRKLKDSLLFEMVSAFADFNAFKKQHGLESLLLAFRWVDRNKVVLCENACMCDLKMDFDMAIEKEICQIESGNYCPVCGKKLMVVEVTVPEATKKISTYIGLKAISKIEKKTEEEPDGEAQKED